MEEGDYVEGFALRGRLWLVEVVVGGWLGGRAYETEHVGGVWEGWGVWVVDVVRVFASAFTGEVGARGESLRKWGANR